MLLLIQEMGCIFFVIRNQIYLNVMQKVQISIILFLLSLGRRYKSKYFANNNRLLNKHKSTKPFSKHCSDVNKQLKC